MNLFERLREERERLKYNQTAFAALVDASKHAQINWEKGIATPNAAALATWAEVGMDVLYVVTGARARLVHLPADEQMWLDCYREWSPEVKKRELRRAMGVAPEGAAESPQAAPTSGAPTHQIGGAHSQHNSGDNAVQIGGNSGGVTQNIRAPVRGGVAGGNIYRKK